MDEMERDEHRKIIARKGHCPECNSTRMRFYGDGYGSFADCEDCTYFDDAPTYAEWERGEHEYEGTAIKMRRTLEANSDDRH